MARTMRNNLAWAGVASALVVGVYFSNPAYALLLGLATRLLTGVNPLHKLVNWGKLSLQTAIVLLGFTLGFDRLVQVSADYGVVVAVFVLGTLSSTEATIARPSCSEISFTVLLFLCVNLEYL